MRRLSVFICFFWFAGFSADAAPSWNNLKKSIVIVKASGVSTTFGNVKLDSWGTGFFIDTDGGILTSYHLVSDLLAKGVEENTVIFEVYRDPNSANPIKASRQGVNVINDLLVLDISTNGEPSPALPVRKRGKDAITKDSTTLYVGGYPAGYPWRDFSLTLTSFEGPLGPDNYLWTVSKTFLKGMSGAPIFLNDGQVVGIVKGVDAASASEGFVVPARYIPANYVEFVEERGQAATQRTGEQVTVRATIDQPIDKIEIREEVLKLDLMQCFGSTASRNVSARKGTRIVPASVNTRVVGGIEDVYVSQIDFMSAEEFKVSIRSMNSTPCPRSATALKVVDLVVGFRQAERSNESVEKIVYQGTVTTEQTLELPESVASKPVSVSTATSKDGKELTKQLGAADAQDLASKILKETFSSPSLPASIGKVTIPIGRFKF